MPELEEKTSSNQPIEKGGAKRILMRPTSALKILRAVLNSHFFQDIIFKTKTQQLLVLKKIIKLKNKPPGLDGYFMFTDRLYIIIIKKIKKRNT